MKKVPVHDASSRARVTPFTHVTACDDLAWKLLSQDIESIRPWPLTGKNKMNALGDLLRIGREPDDELPVMELLARAPLDQLEDAVRALKARRSAAEIRAAMVDRIARAPLTEFEILKEIYLAHCAD